MRKGKKLALVAAGMLATVATLTAHAWDDDKKFNGAIFCEEIAGNTGPGEVPWSGCNALGTPCVVCKRSLNEAGNPNGDEVDPNGWGPKLYRPAPKACGGVKQVGECAKNSAGSWICDTSDPELDGMCGGNVQFYETQPTKGDPGDP